MTIVLEVHCQPVPQPRSRVTVRCGRGHAYTPAKHPVHAYRQAIVEAAASVVGTADPATGAIRLEVDAVFARALSHWRKHDLRPGAPRWPKGDGDNVLKAVADALKDAGVYRDDDQIVEWFIRKRFAARTEQPRTVIRISLVEV